MMRRRNSWIIGALILAASLTLSGVAIATGPTGSVVPTVIGAGSMPNARASPQRRT
jgi:hypothetical protein